MLKRDLGKDISICSIQKSKLVSFDEVSTSRACGDFSKTKDFSNSILQDSRIQHDELMLVHFILTIMRLMLMFFFVYLRGSSGKKDSWQEDLRDHLRLDQYFVMNESLQSMRKTICRWKYTGHMLTTRT